LYGSTILDHVLGVEGLVFEDETPIRRFARDNLAIVRQQFALIL